MQNPKREQQPAPVTRKDQLTPEQTRGEASYRYLEWLESSCFNVLLEESRCSPHHPRPLIDRACVVLKLHALWGGALVVDSISLLASQVLMSLFADPAFRDFLRQCPEFIRLVSVYKDTDQERRQIATSGLSRAVQKNWLSSTFPEQEPIVQLAERLLKAKELDAVVLLADQSSGGIGKHVKEWASRCAPYGDWLTGAVHAVSHFATNEQAPVQRGTVADRVHRLLSLTAEKNLTEEHSARVSEALAFIGEHTSDPAQASHSEIIRVANQVLAGKRWIARRRRVLQTASHAFNASLVRAVGADYGSYASFPEGVPIGLYLGDSLRDFLIPVGDIPRSPTATFRLLRTMGVSWHPRQVNWQQVAAVRREFAETGTEFQRALTRQSAEEVDAATAAHLRCLNSRLLIPPKPSSRPWVWILGGALGLAFGAPDTASLIFRLISSTKATGSAFDGVMKGAYGYVAAETWMDVSKRLRLGPHTIDERNV